jgi:RHS repeat-associated protein
VLRAGQAYWAGVAGTGRSLQVSGPAPLESLVTVELDAGLNLISVPARAAATHTSAELLALTGSEFVATPVSRDGRSRVEVHLPGSPPQPLRPEQVYLVSVPTARRVNWDRFALEGAELRLGYTGRSSLPMKRPFLQLRHRAYDPVSARFLSPDPIGFEGGLNPYTYVGSNPLRYTDPMGLLDPAYDEGRNPVTVYVDADIPNLPGAEVMVMFGFYHEWITTSEGRSAGMGNQHGAPGDGGQSSPDLPYSSTQVVDHRGRMPITREHVPGVDPRALDTYLRIGQSTGPWVPLVNDCNTWARNAIGRSIPRDYREPPDAWLERNFANLPPNLQEPLLILLSRVRRNVVRYADGTYHSPWTLSR